MYELDFCPKQSNPWWRAFWVGSHFVALYVIVTRADYYHNLTLNVIKDFLYIR